MYIIVYKGVNLLILFRVKLGHLEKHVGYLPRGSSETTPVGKRTCTPARERPARAQAGDPAPKLA